ncbi:MAG: DNA repair protein RecN [Armatimonadetes bacterium CP1_7O]|nr:MAG: DNA repair protein RecN [Armatimonadetes bacterium CP1_7O]RMH05696.1 MAG: DNA repair protein RecN [Armatimonadota bacterium]
MLHALHIENLAIIDRLEVSFTAGLNALTGETGAGKSILIDALSLALGERADPTLIRAGAEKLRVNAVFELPNDPELYALLNELGVEPEEGLLYLSREVQAGGRSIARINGQPTPLNTLKAVGERLVDMHGQHEHQSLLKPSSHLEFLDRWLGEPTLSLRAQVRETVQALRQAERELQELIEREREREQMLDLYRFQVDEIRKANLQPGEDELLETEERRLTHAEKLIALAGGAYDALMSENGAYDQTAHASRNLTEIARIDPSVAEWGDMLEGALAHIEEVARNLRAYAEGIEYDPARLEEVIARLELIKRLKRKYGDTLEAILEYAENAESKLHTLETQTERRETLEAHIEALQERATALSAKLSEQRKAGAQRFATVVQACLRDLAMERAEFLVEVRPKPLDATGADSVEFLFSANPGEPPRPLSKIASGGEMSRVMLALKTALADAAPVPTLVFDEVDAGLGGRTAHAVGEKLAELAQHCQILCITHLPQIASRARHHLAIEKQIDGDTTRVQVHLLEGEARVREIARMLAGEPTETALQHARELLQVG